MNGEYDGSITIKTAIDTSGFVAGEKDLAKSAQDAVSKIEGIGDAARRSLERQVENFSRMNDAYRQQAETVERLRAQLDELRETEVMTSEAEALVDEYKRTGEQVDKLKAKMQKMEEMYGEEAATGKSAYQSLNYDLSRMVERYEELSALMEHITDDKYWTKADTTVAEEKLALAEEKQALMLDRLNSKYKDLRANVAKASETATKAHKQMGEEGEKAFDRVTKKSSLSFKNILKYVVGVQTIYAMFNKIKRAASEGLKIVAQYDPQFNEVMSTMKTGISQLKADIGAMLQPILQTIVPILNMVLERLHSALTKVANVIAAIMGQDYIDVVTVKAENYAGALDNVASSAKAATKALGGYDKLNVIQSESSGGGGVAGSAGKAAGAFSDAINYEKKAVELTEEWQKTVAGVAEEAQNIVLEMLEAADKTKEQGGGSVEVVKTLVGQMLENAAEIYEVTKDDLPKWLRGLTEKGQQATGGLLNVLFGDPEKALEHDLKKEKTTLKSIINKEGIVGLAAEGAKAHAQFWGTVFNPESYKDLEATERNLEQRKKIADILLKVFTLGMGGLDEPRISREFEFASQAEYEEWKRTDEQIKKLKKERRDAELEAWIAGGGKDELKKLGANLKEGAKKILKNIAEEKDVKDFQSKLLPSELKGKAVTRLKNFGKQVGTFFSNAFFVNPEDMADTLTSATAASGNDPRVNEAATAVGKQISASIASAVDFTATDTNTVTTRTKKLLSGADSVKLEAEAVGKGVADSISRGLKATTVFSEADGKSTAGQIAKGLEAVSAEANRGGSALSNALHNIGKKISEGINKGTMSVPVTFTGQATPVAAQTNYPKVNTEITITLDGKTISKTVFDEAERISKQTGTGARAGLHYIYSVG